MTIDKEHLDKDEGACGCACGCGHHHEHGHHEEEHHHHHHQRKHKHEHHHDDEQECGCGCGHHHEHHHEHEECCCGHEHHHEHHHDECDDLNCCCHHHEHGHGGHHADEVFVSWGKETAKKFTKDELLSALEELQSEEKYGMVLRAKGIVAGENGWLHFDYVPGEGDVREGSAAVTGRLCVIGCKLNEKALEELF